MKLIRPKSEGEETLNLILKSQGRKFEREHKFHPDRKWRFDFALVDHMVGIEVEGGTFGKSRHTTGIGYTADCEKYNAAALRGWMVLRYTPQMVKNGAVERDLMLLLRGI